MKKHVLGFILMVGLIIGLPIVASAHVTVLPATSATGAYETYTVKVPVEKDSNTTKVVVKLPVGVSFSSYEPVAGWKTTFSKQAKTITWQAQNGGIKAGQFMRFTFSAKNPDKETSIPWNAYQYYQDGSIVEWTGGADADTPHAVTKIVKNVDSGTAADSHGKTLTQKKAAETPVPADSNRWLTWITLVASVIAIVISMIAIVSKRK
ncbi:YcnI family copper-binding membrane protein [Listeria grayi]|uniref:YcnI family copper-binding membrane protein n=1 Tax=Listeria grayi TaxID=1641 RepID=UPI00162418BB|nr:DUF1775 domain-containing protein [Listeria grayi]MBC1922233.1 DUF1775 domain-containing protein [Listeria grayi]